MQAQIPRKLVLTVDPVASPDLAKAHGLDPEDDRTTIYTNVTIGSDADNPLELEISACITGMSYGSALS